MDIVIHRACWFLHNRFNMQTLFLIDMSLAHLDFSRFSGVLVLECWTEDEEDVGTIG
jgi:hypothetical protein